MSVARITASAGAVALGGLSALHGSWALGSSWPAPDTTRLAQVAAGTDEFPSPLRCVEVAALLAVAAGLVAGAGGDRRVAGLGRAGVAAVLLGRGVAGITGNTHRLVGWRTSPEFDRLDRRYFGPLCLAIGAAAVVSATRRTGRTGQQTA